MKTNPHIRPLPAMAGHLAVHGRKAIGWARLYSAQDVTLPPCICLALALMNPRVVARGFLPHLNRSFCRGPKVVDIWRGPDVMFILITGIYMPMSYHDTGRMTRERTFTLRIPWGDPSAAP